MSVSDPSDHVSAYLASAMRRRHAPAAIGVAVVRDGEESWCLSFGAESTALFQAGSISKTVTAAAALELVARGDLELDRNVNDYFTSWRVPESLAPTLRELLGHTSGTGVAYYPGYPQGATVPTLVQSLEGASPASTGPVVIDPSLRGKFAYSGGGYAVVQQLVEDVTGMSFADATRQLILDPVGMRESTFAQTGRTSSRAARSDWRIYPEAGAAGLWTTPADLAKFLRELLVARSHGSSAIQSVTADLMSTPHVPLPSRGQWSMLPWLGVRGPNSAGLGLFLGANDRVINIGGAHHFFSLVTGLGDGGAVVMMASDPHPLIFEALTAVGDAEGWTDLRGPANSLKTRASMLLLRTAWLRKAQ